MTDRDRASAVVHQALLAEWPGRFAPAHLQEHVELGKSGLELDSIEIVELVLTCEERWGTRVATEQLLDAGPISIGRLIDHLVLAA